MPIISLSVNKKLLDEINYLIEDQGYSGKSEVFRAGIRNLIAENKKLNDLKGKIKAVLIIVHQHDAGEFVNKMKHKFEKITETQVHMNAGEKECLEIFNLSGDASQIKKLINALKINKKIKYLKLITP